MKIKQKTLTRIAKTIAEYYTGNEIINILLESGIDRSDIVYPNTKWVMLTTALTPLIGDNFSKLLENVLLNFIHPLNSGDEEKSRILKSNLNKWLKYDDYAIQGFANDAGIITFNLTEEDNEDLGKQWAVEVESTKKLLTKNKEAIGKLKSSYLLLIDVVKAYFENLDEPNEDLNELYMTISDHITSLNMDIREAVVSNNNEMYFPIPSENGVPFRNLYEASSSEHNSKSSTLSLMYKQAGKLVELARDAGVTAEALQDDLVKSLKDRFDSIIGHKITHPKGWDIVEDQETSYVYLTFNGQKKGREIGFNSIQHKLLRLIWDKYPSIVPYPDIRGAIAQYKKSDEKKYKVNAKVRRMAGTLNKKMPTDEVSIEINRGVSLVFNS